MAQCSINVNRFMKGFCVQGQYIKSLLLKLSCYLDEAKISSFLKFCRFCWVYCNKNQPSPPLILCKLLQQSWNYQGLLNLVISSSPVFRARVLLSAIWTFDINRIFVISIWNLTFSVSYDNGKLSVFGPPSNLVPIQMISKLLPEFDYSINHKLMLTGILASRYP